MSGVALLDVNLLVALFDPDHIHHEVAHDWFSDHHASGWATCPITEAGYLRVLSNPTYANGPTPVPDLIDRLRRLCATPHHSFWPEDASLRDDGLFDRSRIHGHRQLTDIYLLGLARKRNGRLVTFDRTIPFAPVKGARRDSIVLLELVD